MCLPTTPHHDWNLNSGKYKDWICPKCIQTALPFAHFDDEEEFLDTIADLAPSHSTISLAKLREQDLIFNPFEVNDEPTDLLFDDIDPDLQYYNQQLNPFLQTCDYFSEHTFNQKLSCMDIDDDRLSYVHMNIRSAPRNLKFFENYLCTLNHKFSIIGLSETWFKEHNKELYGLNGYNGVHNIRNSWIGGGVSLYIKESIEYCQRDDLCQQDDLIESIFIESKLCICE